MPVADPGGISGVDCFLCPDQDHCPTRTCALEATACGCAALQECRWETETNSCTMRIGAGTPCSACPTQEGCNYNPVRALSFQPRQGSTHGGEKVVISITFNVPLAWCDFSGPAVRFWCQGSASIWQVSREHLSLDRERLKADVSHVAQELSRTGTRTCGLIIASGAVCDEQLVSFSGLPKGDYEFNLRDGILPTIVAYNPRHSATGVALNGAVKLTFSEPIKAGADHLQVRLSRLETDRSGTSIAVETELLPLQRPQVFVEDATLTVQLDGIVQPGRLYTLELPAGLVVDLAGNEFSGLPAQRYTFRASTGAVRTAAPSADNSPPIVGIVLGVTGAVLVVAVLMLLAHRLMRFGDCFRADKASARSVPGVATKPNAPRKQQPQTGSSAHNREVPGAWADPSDASGAAASRQPQPQVQRVRPAPEAHAASSAATPQQQQQQQQQQRPQPQQQKEQAQKQQPQHQQHKGPTDRWSGPGHARRQAEARGTATGAQQQQSQQPQPDAVGPTAPPELKAVEKQMRASMGDPIAVRKKLFKELMLEYHPDKNHQAHAKEVFQFINNSRGWFLLE